MRRALGFGLMAVSIIAATVVACGDDDTTNDKPGGDAGNDSSTPRDSSVPDTSSSDSGGGTDASDAGVDAEAGPTTTVTLSSAGRIQVFQDAIFGEFLEDQTIVRASNAPECVAHIGSKGKLFAKAGTLTVGGQIVNSDGGPTQAIAVQPGPFVDDTGYTYEYFAFLDGINIFPPDDSLTLQVQTGGTATVGAMPVQTLRPPPAAQVTVTAPAVPDGGVLNIPSTLPFNVTWTAPDAGADLRVFIGILELDSVQKRANIYCGYPLSAGKATVPANFLGEVRARLGVASQGKIHIWVGGQKEAVVGSDSFVIEVTRPDSTNFLAADQEPQVQLQ